MHHHKNYYERNLPHIQPENGTFFLTYRLYGSIPISVIREFKARYDGILRINHAITSNRLRRLQMSYFLSFDNCLDREFNEPYWLKEPDVAEIVFQSLLFNNKKEYDLWAFTIMPNHVHALLTLKEGSMPLFKILQNHKRYTAGQCNKVLKRTGYFWEHETYDHLVKSENEFSQIVEYILNNPVKAGFVKDWDQWKWNYISPALL